MLHIIPISGGKDSQATAIWFRNQISLENENVVLLFCDTGHEAQTTYDFLFKVFVPALPKFMQNLAVVKNKRGETLMQQAIRKKRFPSTKARFCTTELKIEPMIDFILAQTENVKIYDGRRHAESPARAHLERYDEYFFDYYTGSKTKSGNRKTLYRRKDVLAWCEKYSADVVRPIVQMSTKEVFDFIVLNEFTRNPLYDKGFNRVGCFPCIMCSLGEIVRVAEHEPERIEAIRNIEIEHNTTFFGPNKIPVRFCKKQVKNEAGELVGAPSIDEVIAYAKDKRYDDGLFAGQCMNRYVKCE